MPIVMLHRVTNTVGCLLWFSELRLILEEAQKNRRGELMKEYWETKVGIEAEDIVTAVKEMVLPLANDMTNWLP